MSHIHVQRPGDASGLASDLATATCIALDCEAAGFHRYSDRLCLVQVTVAERTYVLDPFGFDPTELLSPALEDPDVAVVMHGADFDLRLLRRDLGIRLRGLADTQISAALLGEDGLGLASLLESRLGISLSKKYQRADWAERPLSDAMLEYAASDTRHLVELHDLLVRELGDADRLSWAREEWLALEQIADEPMEPEGSEDPVARVKGARKMSVRTLARLREALAWRDEIARERDRAPFRVAGDAALVQTATFGARRVEDLTDVKGFPKALAREHGKALVDRLHAVDARPESELVPYPRGARRGPGRPPPELEDLVDRLKEARNRAAERLGLPRGTLLSNTLLQSIAQASPGDVEALCAIDGMRRWKVEVLGAEILEILRRAG